MTRILPFEISQARPIEPFAQIDFRDRNGAPILGLGEDAPLPVVDSGDHPVARNISVSAADEEYMVLAGARGG